MSLAIISDIHIKSPGDDGDVLLQSFLNSDEVKNSTDVFLLGDIFDLMVGNHEEYYKSYSVVFHQIEELIHYGKTFHFVEGNHDFHLEKLFEEFLKRKKAKVDSIKYYRKGFYFNYNNKTFYFSHGDDIELGNPTYKIYKKFIASYPLKLVANYLMPYKILNLIGENASKKSRARNVRKYSTPENQEQIKQSFRVAAKQQWDKKHCDYVICGHSHAKDDFTSESGFRYLNCGFVKREKNFISIEKDEVQFIGL